MTGTLILAALLTVPAAHAQHLTTPPQPSCEAYRDSLLDALTAIDPTQYAQDMVPLPTKPAEVTPGSAITFLVPLSVTSVDANAIEADLLSLLMTIPADEWTCTSLAAQLYDLQPIPRLRAQHLIPSPVPSDAERSRDTMTRIRMRLDRVDSAAK